MVTFWILRFHYEKHNVKKLLRSELLTPLDVKNSQKSCIVPNMFPLQNSGDFLAIKNTSVLLMSA